ncbi:bifunctional diguanylate cyclase/phosphodiesterase [Crenobacter caeni]|uniref:EAL domain-containing protein n=1 Tax=Crenobacter caeni TaxID=2705474 RepID=A0A6B2KUJ9_9NEIS|nr:EAL domain-containing protein [Crenobacter caeni]NDV13679.1 EAL domain-containing protein [Crenobacter caeni]
MKAGISFKLTGLVLAISVLPLFLYQVISFSATRNTIVDMATRHSTNLLNEQASHLSLQMAQIEDLIRNIESVDEIKQAVARVETANTKDTSFEFLSTQARIGYILSGYGSLKGLVSIDLFTRSGRHYHVGDTLNISGINRPLLGRLQSDTQAAGNAVAWHGIEDNVNSTSSKRKVIVASKMLNRLDGSGLKTEPLAMLQVNFDPEFVYRHFHEIESREGSTLLVVDAKRRLLFHPDSRLIGQSINPELARLVRGQQGSMMISLNEQPVALNFRMLPINGWYIVSLVPQATLLEPVSRIAQAGIVILLLSLLLIFLFIRLYSIHIINPLRAICDGFRDFQAGRLEPHWRLPKAQTLQELGELTSWFNAFLDRAQEREQAEANLRIAATAFEAQEGMVITDAEQIIIRVNQAFCDTTGYSSEEVTGQHIRLLQSGRHGAEFYREMWQAVAKTGSWQGEVWNRRKNGSHYPEWLTVTSVRNEHGQTTHYVGTMTDITLRKRAEEEIQRLAYFDPLTNLPNRRMLLDTLERAIARSTRNGQSGALLFIDMDNFKDLNDTQGHDKGDLMLQQVAQRLRQHTRGSDTVARLGGDEFVVLLEGLGDEIANAASHSKAVADKLLASLQADYVLGKHVHHSSCSIGVALFSGEENRIEDILKQADLAMYQAKSAGRNAVCFFDQGMQQTVDERAQLESSLREAIARNQLELHYQVQVNHAGMPVGAEALLRWHHPERGSIPPVQFIPLAEKGELIILLGNWVLETACRQLKEWSRHPASAELTLAVNISPRQFHQADFVQQVVETIARTGANPARLKLEITESMLLDHASITISKMEALKSRGIGFALDDFGTGYSSLAYLKRLPLDQLKIDRGFVCGLQQAGHDAAIVRTILALAETLDMAVIAEGVETIEQQELLASMGCHNYQGYFFGRPLPPEKFVQHHLLAEFA